MFQQFRRDLPLDRRAPTQIIMTAQITNNKIIWGSTVVLQYQISHLSLLANDRSLSHEDKYNMNIKVKNKTESKDLTQYF